MDYSELSDFEVNRSVAESIFAGHDGLIVIRSRASRDEVSIFSSICGEDICIAAADYCNNPADAWPIITENKISIAFDKHEEEWVAWGDFSFDLAGWGMTDEPAEYLHDKNPLRAAMVVFLMMQEKASD